MMDFNVGEREIILGLGNHKIVKQDDLIMIYSNDQMYFLKSSIYNILNHLTKEYIDSWIDKALELKTIKNRLDEINEPFKTLLLKRYGGGLFLFNPDDVVCVSNGCENWLNVMEKLNGSIQVNFG